MRGERAKRGKIYRFLTFYLAYGQSAYSHLSPFRFRLDRKSARVFARPASNHSFRRHTRTRTRKHCLLPQPAFSSFVNPTLVCQRDRGQSTPCTSLCTFIMLCCAVHTCLSPTKSSHRHAPAHRRLHAVSPPLLSRRRRRRHHHHHYHSNPHGHLNCSGFAHFLLDSSRRGPLAVVSAMYFFIVVSPSVWREA